jgi:hypothetical protein
MRKVNITSPAAAPEETSTRAAQDTALLTLWSGLGSAGLTTKSAAALPLLPLLENNARFVISLVKQYQKQGISPEALVKAAHASLITLLNQYAGRRDALDKGMTLALRNAMAALVQMKASQ